VTVEKNSQVAIYSDGACLGNPGPGGWAAVLLCGGHRREISGGYRRTTNNRMELLAVVEALECLKASCSVTVFTDSRYLHDAVNKGWLAKWRGNGWLTSEKKPVKNRDLWVRLDILLKAHKVRFFWVRGHAGDPENECCDRLAKAAAMCENLPEDMVYARGQEC